MDSKARKILLKAYWDSTGWKNGKVSDEDYEYAVMHGSMFRPVEFSHKQTLENIKKVCNDIKPTQVASAFLYSLSTRALEYRSALGSYIYAKSIPDYESTSKSYCQICGYEELEFYEYQRTWDVFNFERIKWGGVRHDHSSYAMFDLFQFQKLPRVSPANEDIEIFNKIISAAKELANGGPRDLEKAISSFIPSNKAEREKLLGILGICSIFQTQESKGYLDHFTPLYHRDPPPVGRSNDWDYPVSWWKAQNGIDETALYEVFGDYIKG